MPQTVHVVAGAAALAVAKWVGPRTGRYEPEKDGGMASLPLARRSDALTFLGSLLVWLGLFVVAATAAPGEPLPLVLGAADVCEQTPCRALAPWWSLRWPPALPAR